ncbi:MAG: 50S ribosomal protein L34e [Promethearchaeota archaeon]|nr:MAG: 50S ribosomal protein L34e [Candidatus Lokiarchaeota archaeon]
MPRPALRSKSQARKKVKLPGNQKNTHYWRSKPKRAHCSICKRPLQSVPRLRASKMKKTNRTARRATRIESGRYCSKCLQALIKQSVRQS